METCYYNFSEQNFWTHIIFRYIPVVREGRSNASKENRSSIKEHKENALALGADEGRDKLR